MGARPTARGPLALLACLLLGLAGQTWALWPRPEAYTLGSRTLCLARNLKASAAAALCRSAALQAVQTHASFGAGGQLAGGSPHVPPPAPAGTQRHLATRELMDACLPLHGPPAVESCARLLIRHPGGGV